MFCSNYSVIFQPQTRQMLIFEEFIYNLYFQKSINTSIIYVEDDNFQEKGIKKDELNEKIQANTVNSELIGDQQDISAKEGNQKSNVDEKNEHILPTQKQESNVKANHQEIDEISENEQEIDERDEFDSKKRHYIEEFFKYTKVEKYCKEIQIDQFIRNIINRNLLSIDKLIVYIKLKQLNKYQIEDAQNYGVDYSLYQLNNNSNRNNQDQNQLILSQKHSHSVYLLKVDGSFNMWLGYARIAHNVKKVIIIAQINYIDGTDLALDKFDKIFKDWLKLKKIKIKSEDEILLNKNKEEEEFECQIVQLTNSFNLNLISFGVSKDN